MTLICDYCEISGELDFRRCSSIQTIGLNGNKLTRVEIGEHPNLYLINVSGNQLSSIDLSGVPKLESLSLSYCPIGNALNDELKKVPEVHFLICSRCNLTELDLSGNPRLIYLDSQNNQLTTLDLSHNGDKMHILCRQRFSKEIETIYIRAGQTIYGLTDSFDDSYFSPTTNVVVK